MLSTLFWIIKVEPCSNKIWTLQIGAFLNNMYN